ncbi:hypothetical protein HGT70_14285 [Rosenbergiella collisarenosi]|uniref:hypothetical protein n=1 Tax=Rosenbergiella collisarenosi TaxID=1544695 RepID=UPI001BDADB8F|nr:hypothetical protein [Rosenbergiella collisarenosi]MBT0722443.1 hypothetical protein [Rosenbergiella collisarenosi]
MLRNKMSDLYNLDRLKFTAAYVPFGALRLRDAQGVWVNTEFTPPWPEGQSEHEQDDLARMAECWGIAAPDAAIFKPVHLQPEHSVTAWAEAYGGKLIGGNGGGGRVGIYGGVQIKGIGKTPMIGKQTNIQHSYGALLLEQAMTEALYTHLSQRILPYGCAQVYGIIATGVRITFNDPAMRSWRECADAALLLRQPCLRPAHFLRAEFFVPWRAHPELMDDTQRIRQLYRELAGLSRGHMGFEQMMFNFLARCAAQFATARFNRFIHGTLSPSNLTLDGRWLDLMSTSILPTGKNYKPAPDSPSFQAEHLMPLEIVMEMIYLYNKINTSRIDSGQFSTFYESQWDMQKLVACARLYGFTSVMRSGQAALFPALKAIAKATEQILTKEKKICSGWAEPDTNIAGIKEYADPKNDALWNLLLGFHGLSEYPLAEMFHELLYSEWNARQMQSENEANSSFRCFKISRFLSVGRRLLFGAYFYRTRIDNEARRVAEIGVNVAGAWLKEQISIVDMIYADDTGDVMLLSLPSIQLTWHQQSQAFSVSHEGKNVLHSTDPNKIREVMADNFTECLIMRGYDFLPGCQALLEAANQLLKEA